MYGLERLSELVLERKIVMTLRTMLTSDTIVLVYYFLTSSMPSLTLLTSFLRKDQRFKTITEQTLLLHQIYNIKSHLLILLSTSHLKIKPLVMSSTVRIILQHQIKNLDCRVTLC